MVIELKLDPEQKDLRLFSFLLIPFSILVGVLVSRWSESVTWSWALATILGGMGILGAIRPEWVRWLFVGWMVLVFPVGWLVSNIIIATIYFGVFTPFGLIARMFGYDPLQTRPQETESYWHDLKPIQDKQQYFRQF